MITDREWTLYDYFTLNHPNIKPCDLTFTGFKVLTEIKDSIDPYEWLNEDMDAVYYMNKAHASVNDPYNFELHIMDAQYMQLQDAFNNIREMLIEFYTMQENK